MKLCRLLLLAAALPLSAQEPQPQPTEAAPETTTNEVAPPADTTENPKLKLGHPLDPADVATLTGRDAEPQRRYAEPVVYLTIPGDYGNLWLQDAPVPPLFFGSTRNLHGRRLSLHGQGVGTPRIFFPVFNGMFFVTPR